MCEENCGDCVEKGFERARVGDSVWALLQPVRASRMRSKKCQLVWVGRKPVVS